MSKRDSQEQLKRRIKSLEEERDELIEANDQIKQAVDAVLREVVRQCGKENENGELVLILPTPNLLGNEKVMAARDGASYVLTLSEGSPRGQRLKGEGDSEK